MVPGVSRILPVVHLLKKQALGRQCRAGKPPVPFVQDIPYMVRGHASLPHLHKGTGYYPYHIIKETIRPDYYINKLSLLFNFQQLHVSNPGLCKTSAAAKGGKVPA